MHSDNERSSVWDYEEYPLTSKTIQDSHIKLTYNSEKKAPNFAAIPEYQQDMLEGFKNNQYSLSDIKFFISHPQIAPLLNTTDDNGNCPLSICINQNDVSKARILLSCKHLKVTKQTLQLIQRNAQKKPLNFEMKNLLKKTPPQNFCTFDMNSLNYQLMKLAEKTIFVKDDAAKIVQLVKRGADLNYNHYNMFPDSVYGQSILYKLIQNGHITALQQLADNGLLYVKLSHLVAITFLLHCRLKAQDENQKKLPSILKKINIIDPANASNCLPKDHKIYQQLLNTNRTKREQDINNWINHYDKLSNISFITEYPCSKQQSLNDVKIAITDFEKIITSILNKKDKTTLVKMLHNLTEDNFVPISDSKQLHQFFKNLLSAPEFWPQIKTYIQIFFSNGEEIYYDNDNKKHYQPIDDFIEVINHINQDPGSHKNNRFFLSKEISSHILYKKGYQSLQDYAYQQTKVQIPTLHPSAETQELMRLAEQPSIMVRSSKIMGQIRKGADINYSKPYTGSILEQLIKNKHTTTLKALAKEKWLRVHLNNLPDILQSWQQSDCDKDITNVLSQIKIINYTNDEPDIQSVYTIFKNLKSTSITNDIATVKVIVQKNHASNNYFDMITFIGCYPHTQQQNLTATRIALSDFAEIFMALATMDDKDRKSLRQQLDTLTPANFVTKGDSLELQQSFNCLLQDNILDFIKKSKSISVEQLSNHIVQKIELNKTNSNININQSLSGDITPNSQVSSSDDATTPTYKNITAVSSSLSENTKIRSSGKIGKEQPKNDRNTDTAYDMQQML